MDSMSRIGFANETTRGGSDSNQNDYGFRVAMVPEPSGFSLLVVGLGGLAALRRRKSE
jgi:hypothetical protein